MITNHETQTALTRSANFCYLSSYAPKPTHACNAGLSSMLLPSQALSLRVSPACRHACLHTTTILQPAIHQHQHQHHPFIRAPSSPSAHGPRHPIHPSISIHPSHPDTRPHVHSAEPSAFIRVTDRGEGHHEHFATRPRRSSARHTASAMDSSEKEEEVAFNSSQIGKGARKEGKKAESSPMARVHRQQHQAEK